MIIIFGLKIIIPFFLIPVKFSLFFHSCFSSLWHFHCSFLCFENGPWSWELPPGVFSRILFLSFILFRFCIVLAIFPSFALKIVLGNYQKEFFLESCRFFSFLYRFDSFWLCLLPLPWKLTLEIVNRNFFSNPFRFFSFIFMLAIFPHCLQNWPWKLSKGAFSRTRFVFFRFGYFPSFVKRSFFSNPFRFFFPLYIFPPLLSKLTLKLSKRCFFSNPFRFFFILAIFPPLPSKLTLEIVKRSFFSNPFRVFSLFFLFWLFFLLCLPNPWKLSKTLFLEPFSFCFVFFVYFSFFRFDYFSSFAFKPWGSMSAYRSKIEM